LSVGAASLCCMSNASKVGCPSVGSHNNGLCLRVRCCSIVVDDGGAVQGAGSVGGAALMQEIGLDRRWESSKPARGDAGAEFGSDLRRDGSFVGQGLGEEG